MKHKCILFFTMLFVFFIPLFSAQALVIYEVKQGDSLNKISKQYKGNSKDISKLNGLNRDDKLVIGQALLLPGTTYYVKSGETLWDIAYRHSLSTSKLKDRNKMTNDTLIPGQKLIIPSSPKKTIWTGTYFVPKDKHYNNWILEHSKNAVTGIFVFEYHPTTNANLIQVNEKESNKLAWKKGIIPYATLTNLSYKGFDPNLIHKLISNITLRKKFINNIYALLDRNDYKGVSIDFEMVKPTDRNYLNLFIKELSTKLHRSKMEVLIAMPPKEGDRIPDYYNGYDYKTIGKYVDKMFLMTYNWHWPSGPPGPIAPLDKINTTLQYAVSVVPRSKLLLGIPQYAYDWPITGENRKGSAYSTQNAIEMYKKYESQVYFDQNASSPAFRYIDKNGIQHEVWFEDPRSLLSKFRLAKKYGLAGMGCWHLGISILQTEKLLLTEFRIK